MRGLKVPKKEGEKIRQALQEHKLLLPHYVIKRDAEFIYFPVRRGIPGYDTVECSFEEKKRHPEPLKKLGIASFDVIGDIAIVDIPEELEEKKNEVVKILLSRKFIHTVLQKTSRIEGEFRTRRFNYLGGEKKTETVHTEYGLKFKLNLETVYFNPRLSTERFRIAHKVEPGETVIDMFCGVGPFSLMISRFSRAEKIYAIDINPEAIKFLHENIKLNKIKNVIPILGDAKEEVPKIGHADRVIMNLPQEAFKFLREALNCGKIIHYYTITSDLQGEIDRIRTLGTVLEYKTVKSYSPDMEMYRIDVTSRLFHPSTG